jgi:pyruvate dehydrogenase E1 component alpha subunit
MPCSLIQESKQEYLLKNLDRSGIQSSATSEMRPITVTSRSASTSVRQQVSVLPVPSQFTIATTANRFCSKRKNVTVRASTKVNATAAPQKSQGQQKISAEDAKELYRDMFLGREFEEMCAQMYYRGKMFGFVHLYSGQEAVSTGTFFHLGLGSSD